MKRRTLLFLTALALAPTPAMASWHMMQGRAAVGFFHAAANTTADKLGVVFMCDQVYGLQFIIVPDLATEPDSRPGAAVLIDFSIDGGAATRLPATVDLTPDHLHFRIFSNDPRVAAVAAALKTAKANFKVTINGAGKPLYWQTFDVAGAPSVIPQALRECGVH